MLMQIVIKIHFLHAWPFWDAEHQCIVIEKWSSAKNSIQAVLTNVILHMLLLQQLLLTDFCIYLFW